MHLVSSGLCVLFRVSFDFHFEYEALHYQREVLTVVHPANLLHTGRDHLIGSYLQTDVLVCRDCHITLTIGMACGKPLKPLLSIGRAAESPVQRDSHVLYNEAS